MAGVSLLVLVSIVLARLADLHDPEHAGLHVEQHVAVECPAPRRIGRHAKRAPRARRHADRVLAHLELAGFVLEVAPHAMQMDRVLHHRVVDERDANALAVAKLEGL